MEMAVKKILSIIITVIVISSVFSCFPAFFLNADSDGYARDITSSCNLAFSDISYSSRASDGIASSGAVCKRGATLKISAPENIGALYILFNSDGMQWTLSFDGRKYTYGKNGFLHEYVDISEDIGKCKDLELSFGEGCNISEIYIFSEGQRQDWVQVWQPTLEHADLLLFVAHSDDDQLFFAGLIPLYVSRGYKVQVAYLTYHPKAPKRRHELLDGLWTAGTVYYPMYGKFDDFRTTNLQLTIDGYIERGTKYSELQEFAVETIRACRPLVVTTHDVDGEYGHGMHRLLSQLVRESVEICPDPKKYTDSVKKHGAWRIPKTYIHLYSENKIVLDIDSPLDAFGGKSAFRVSQEAFLKHKSQHSGWYFEWQQGTPDKPVVSSKELSTYNPAYYGLYNSTVGRDVNKNDMFENLISYSQKAEYDALFGDASDAYSSLKSDYNELKDKYDSQKNDIDKKSKELKEKQEIIETQGTQIAEMSNEIEQKNSLLVQSETEIERLGDEIEQRDNRIAEKDTLISQMEETVGKQNETITQNEEKINALELSVLQNEETIAQKQSQITQKDGLLAEASRHKEELEGELSVKESEMDELKKQSAALQKQLRRTEIAVCVCICITALLVLGMAVYFIVSRRKTK